MNPMNDDALLVILFFSLPFVFVALALGVDHLIKKIERNLGE